MSRAYDRRAPAEERFVCTHVGGATWTDTGIRSGAAYFVAHRTAVALKNGAVMTLTNGCTTLAAAAVPGASSPTDDRACRPSQSAAHAGPGDGPRMTTIMFFYCSSTPTTARSSTATAMSGSRTTAVSCARGAPRISVTPQQHRSSKLPKLVAVRRGRPREAPEQPWRPLATRDPGQRWPSSTSTAAGSPSNLAAWPCLTTVIIKDFANRSVEAGEADSLQLQRHRLDGR